MSRHTNIPDNKHLIYGGAYSVHDAVLSDTRDKLIREFTNIDSSFMPMAHDIKQTFLDTYRFWMFKGFNFKNTHLYHHACFTQGTTESFSQFYIRYRDNHRLRLKKAEYFYHQMMKSLWYHDRFAWLDEDKIRAGDAVLISVPFSDTGDAPNELDTLLDSCDRLGVPVMLDMAFLNLTHVESFPYSIDLARDCIQYVVTSLSKVFPVENLRIGMRLQKHKMEDQLYVINEKNYNYINLLSAYVGHGMIKEFDNDFVFKKYRPRQIELCQTLGLEISPCFNFGIDKNNRYPEYNRGGSTNRLCFSRSWDGRSEKLSLVDQKSET
jgi:hypothetical protein